MNFRYQNTATIDSTHDGQRLDLFIQEFTKSTPHPLTRTKAQELIDNGLVLVNERSAKSSLKVKCGDSVSIKIPELPDMGLLSYDFPIKILHEDENVIVVHKPAGLVVHPAAGHSNDTLVNVLLSKVAGLSSGLRDHRPGIVHRLDKDTSGILVVAKTDLAMDSLVKQFKDRSVRRHYHALVFGKPAKREGVIESLLERHPIHRKKFRSGSQGKRAVTHFRFIDEKSGISLIRCRLETGRTHQIRVHLSENGLPIVGDPVYTHPRRLKSVSSEIANEIKDIRGIGLHAYELGFVHPVTNEDLVFTESWPENLKSLIEKLGFQNV